MAMDNKHNLAQREQYYAAVQKGVANHDRIPEYPEDISPYATFHVASGQHAHPPVHPPVHPPPSSFLYHEQRLAAMETLQLKSVSATNRAPRGQASPPDSGVVRWPA